jgi:hypothetical protein
MPNYCFDPQLSRWTRPQAVAIFGAALVLITWSLAALYWPHQGLASAAPEGGKDLEVYRRIVARVHQGEDYYDAAGAELHAGGYATSSVFNWRLPVYAWLLAAFPRPEGAQVLLGLLALLALSLAFAGDRENGSVGRSLLLVIAMAGAFLWCIDGDAFFSQELWAGVLIAVSVGCFAVGWRVSGIVVGLAALFLRELALPYVLVAIVLACSERRWREAAAWCLGVGAFAVLLAWHAWKVQQHLTGQEWTEAEGWIQFGGPAFVVRTSQMNVWLFNLPAWLGLAYLLATMLGLLWWRGSQALRIGSTVALYVAAFLIVGKPFNAYWGLLYVALLPWGLIRAGSALRELTFLLLPVSQIGCLLRQTYDDGK